MAPLRIRTFGGLSLEGTGHAGPMPKGRRPLALLALLATSGSRGLSRDKVTALLWSESDSERGRNSLSQVLSSLRRDLGPDDPVLGTAEIRLNADMITSDVEDFEASIADGEVERAVAVHCGPFLDGFYLTDAPEFERWVEEQRARLGETQRDALEQLAVNADRRGDRTGAVSWWRRLAALDPTSARAAVGLMEALAASGDGPAALRHFHIYTALLEQELHAEPDAAVVALAEHLRRGDRVTRNSLAPAPTFGPADVAAVIPTSTVATVATKATSRVSWWRSGRNRVYAMAALTLLVGVLLALWATGVGPFATLLSAGTLGPNEPLLIADFKVTGPDSALSGTLAQMMRSGLSQSRVIELVPLSRVATALERMARARDSRIDLPLAREIARREGIKAVVGGTLTPLSRGTGYILSTQLVLASTGDELASFDEAVDGSKDLVAAVDRLSRKLRKRIGESLKSVRADPPLADVTTASLEALTKYTEALQANVVHNYDRAVTLLEEAIALDTNFAMAYRQLVISMNNSRSVGGGVGGEQISQSAFPRMRMMTERAYRLRDRLPERERLQTISLYFGGVGDRAKARATYETLLSKYPRTPGAANFHATSFLMQSREFARAESVYATLIAADTSVAFPYSNIFITQIAQGKFAEARRSVERLVRQFPNLSDGTRYRSQLYYALGQVDSSDRILRDLASSSSQTDRLYALNVLTAYALLRGQIAKVRPQMEETRALATAIGRQPLPLQDAMTLAQIQLVFFNRREIATRMLDRALRDAPRESVLEADGRPYLHAASLYASAGRPDKAREVLALYDRDIKDTVPRRLDERDRKLAMTQVGLVEGRASNAVAEFRRADAIYGGPISVCAVCIDPDIGRAFDRAGMPDSAIAVFEHFVNAPSVRREIADAWNLHWILRRLGELHEARGDREAAVKYYQKFVTLWKDADPDLQPVVDEVRRRLSRLERVESVRNN
jgi:DNA-binding SARP family transcriptional activator